MSSRRPCREFGTTLIELIVFMMIVGVALAGVLTVFGVSVRSSADPMARKQMQSIAEALLDEVQSLPFTWCDPDDRSAATATSATLDATATDPAQCWDAVEAVGVETVSGNTDNRLSATDPFDNVSDYNGLTNVTTGVTGAAFPAGYSASISVSSSALSTVPVADSLLITVTVCRAAACPSAGAETLVLEGYRTRFAPNSLP
ncbi:MAG: type II secretion system protein [Rhodocyclales bacterium]|nr:type II secretion system protein [Rhodocyclales bacterium]